MSRELKYLVIHCTATPQGREVSSAEIRRWHTSPPPGGRGWSQVGYTDLFHINGGVERLVDNNEDSKVDPWEITNGAAGFNSVCRHIVYVGGMTADNSKPMDTRSVMQRQSMGKYVKDFMRRFPLAKVVGHRELDPNKACPSFEVSEWLNTL
jgi:N-acetylmuramoyl-L-alanine amidase